MKLMNPSLFPKTKPISTHPKLKSGFDTSSSDQKSVHFSGDAFLIYSQLRLKSPIEAKFKEICDTIVWQKNDKTINVAEMTAFLCRKRDADGYPGYGSIETLAKAFPGLEITKLEKSFRALLEPVKYMGFDKDTSEYWLRPEGLEMLKKVYPAISLPPENDLITRLFSPANSWL
ncbi:MAG: hypothetical protein K2X66_14595 [Cyanobacteria bacterium]|nr:hypothetical protein [Cyanobacteriota bacterium]